jgi:single-strand DNA-binding protein
MNKVILIGNLGGDAELKYTQGGQAVCRIRLCTNKKWTDKDGKKQERAEWHTCNYWGKGGEAVAQYLKSGKQVAIEGELQTRDWIDKDGGKRYSTEINVNHLELLGGAGGGGRQQGSVSGGAAQGGGESLGDDDIPF